MTAVGDLLDGLEAAAKAATPGPWLTWRAPDVTAIGSGFEMYEGVPSNPNGWVVSGASGLTPADAACIVVEHNAVPRLTAAIRAVLEIHRRTVVRADDGDWGICTHDGHEWPCVTVRALGASS